MLTNNFSYHLLPNQPMKVYKFFPLLCIFMEWLFYCTVYKQLLISKLLFNNVKMPVPIRDFHLPSPLLAGNMQGGMARPLHSPWCGTLSSPHMSSGVLFRLPSPGRSIIMAPLRTSCQRKPRTGCRSLPSFSCYGLSVYPLRGRHIMAKLIVRRNLFKGKPFKAAAYWYSVFKFPTFRRKAFRFKHKFLPVLKPIIRIPKP